MAILDWFSRYVVAWALSPTLEAAFCVAALETALATGRRPEIFNSDHGSQFTSEAFTGVLEGAGVAISRDGRGGLFDNIFVERLWRSVKYEEVYLKDYEGLVAARSGLGCRIPAEVYGEPARRAGAGICDAAGTPVALRAPSVPAADPVMSPP